MGVAGAASTPRLLYVFSAVALAAVLLFIVLDLMGGSLTHH
jgi:hypothetical protein